ncbi:MAG TPA: ATP-dependent DNA ligase [Patescibacteria group bacterium]|jgi:DNA ligase-1|nr:ATP-dependent DNA ligase [Patescibacteria group bacterium]
MLSTVFSKFFNEIELIDSRTLITEKLAALLTEATSKEAAIIANFALGQMHPPYHNKQFGMAEKSVIKAIAQAFKVNVELIQIDAKKAGDVGLVCAQHSWPYTCKLSVEQLYEQLLLLENKEGVGSVENKIGLLATILKQLDAVSAKFVVRIVIGKLRLGFSDMTILDALSVMVVGDKSARTAIEYAYNICVDIGKIVYELKEKGLPFIRQKKVELGVPIMPAAAERLPTAQAIIEKIGACVAQPKLDGFRVQIHIDNSLKPSKVHFFSRNLKDMSAMFPDLIADLEALSVKQLIVEGEAIVFDQNTGTFLPFQETVKRKRKHDIDLVALEYPLKLFLFDLLYLDGVEQLSFTHVERRKALVKICQDHESARLSIIEEKDMDNAASLEAYFYAMVGAGLEGLVVKKPDALYRPGKRDFNWIKLKRQEEGHLDDTIDCVLLGYYKGKGKRAAFGIGALLVGIYSKKEDCFQTIAKIGTGLTDAEWIDIKNKADECAVQNQPHNVRCAGTLAPDVWTDPIIVCMIRADEITLSPVHSAGKTENSPGYALRFPRFMGYRVDKSAINATTEEEAKELYNLQFNRRNA